MKTLIREDVLECLETLLDILFDTPEDYEDFHKWAFGEIREKLYQNDINLWNDRHGHVYKIDLDGNVFEDLPIMCAYWQVEKMKREKESLYK